MGLEDWLRKAVASVLERVLAWEPQLRGREEELRAWRSSVDEGLLLLEQKHAATVRDADLRILLPVIRGQILDAVEAQAGKSSAK